MSGESGYHPPGSFITHLTKVGFKRNRRPSSDDEFEIHYLDLTPLKLDVSRFTPLLVSKRLSSHNTVTLDNLEPILPGAEAVAKREGGMAVLVLGGKLSPGVNEIAGQLGPGNVVILDNSDIKAIEEAADAEARARMLAHALVRFAGREMLSPYTTGRPAAGGRFFARTGHVRQMLNGVVNFTVVGNRRIGKTSLLNEVKEQLLARNENYRVAEVYGGSCHSTVDVVHDILHKLDQFLPANRVIEFPHTVRNLPDTIHNVARAEKRPVAVFIDELDHVLAFDERQNYELLHLLRATFLSHSSCRIIMAGFRKVMEAVQNLDHPLYNFGKTIELPLFSRQESYEMVVKPLDHLDIDLTASELPEAIYRETSGHPELIQVHCAEIIRHVEETGRVPDETTHLTRMFESPEYKQRVLGAFLANTNAHEELLCYLLIADGEETSAADYEFGPRDVDRVLKQKGIVYDVSQITTITGNLKTSGIITQVAGTLRYRFSVPQFASYCSSLDLNFCIEKAFEKIKDAPGAISALAP
jgi:hypothetical protein